MIKQPLKSKWTTLDAKRPEDDEKNPTLTTYIRDDLGHAWFYDPDSGRIKCVGDDSPDGGYFCSGLEEGVSLLNEYGYISGEEKPPVSDLIAAFQKHYRFSPDNGESRGPGQYYFCPLCNTWEDAKIPHAEDCPVTLVELATETRCKHRRSGLAEWIPDAPVLLDSSPHTA